MDGTPRTHSHRRAAQTFARIGVMYEDAAQRSLTAADPLTREPLVVHKARIDLLLSHACLLAAATLEGTHGEMLDKALDAAQLIWGEPPTESELADARNRLGDALQVVEPR
jgi:hypothetical protein